MWSNTVLVFDISSQLKLKPRKNRIVQKIYANWDQISEHRHSHDELLMSLKMYIDALNPISFMIHIAVTKKL